jgi:hypothetical protein|tara:strand:+ start:315 stop:557 length:243 start_codon:yes stop_codon:yes gene_type:complete
MQAGFTFNKRDDRNSFEKSLYELKMSFDDIIRGTAPIIERGGIHRGDTHSIELFWNDEDNIDLNAVTDLAYSCEGTITIV